MTNIKGNETIIFDQLDYNTYLNKLKKFSKTEFNYKPKKFDPLEDEWGNQLEED